MQPERIIELLKPFLAAPIAVAVPRDCHSEPAQAGEEPAALSRAQLQSISTYIDLLLRWNARISLTAIRDPEEIVTRHFGESFFAARHLFPRIADASAVADLGSGAGFPGIPMKLWVPHVSLTLIESNHKKATFLREVARALTLTDINIQNLRAEDLARQAQYAPFDVVTLRAVEHFEDVLPTAFNLVNPDGRLALLIGSAQADHAYSTLPFMHWIPLVPIPQSSSRVLMIGQKVTDEPIQ